MKIREVINEKEANTCDNLLTQLILSEKNFNDNIKEEYIIKDYFKNFYDKENRKIFIALEDDKIVGYIYIKITSFSESPEKDIEALIDGLYVLEEYRGRNIATMLIEKAKSWAIDNNVKYISLNVLEKNEIAKKLYFKLGFETFSINLRKEL